MARLRLVPPIVTDPLTDSLVEAMRYYGGVGHRSLIIAYVLAARRAAGSPTEAEAVQAAFESGLGDGPEDARPFRLPFGRGSHRWALKEALER